jgi:hypothetical protein
MYEIGDKYEVQDLKELSRMKFSDTCKAFWETDDFSVAANHAFSTTTEDAKGLRDTVVGTIIMHMKLICKPEVQAVMMEYQGLALRVLLKKADEHGVGSGTGQT